VTETRYAKSGDLNIAYQVVGDGLLNLLYVDVPGWASNVAAMWGGSRTIELALAQAFEAAAAGRLIRPRARYVRPPHVMTEPSAIRAIDRVDDARRDELLALFQSAWWTAARTPEAIARMLDGSDVVVGLVDSASDQLVAFARAITDGVFLAIVLDVIVAPDRRRSGLGARLMDELLARPELADVDSIELVCQPELVDFYRRWGFTDSVGRSLLMRRSSNPLLVGGSAPQPAPQ
jgi:GNAT superfamily N-acetyltransferase